jgi:tight adherence protein B
MPAIILYLVFVAALFAALQGCRYLIDDLREETRSEMSQVRQVRLADGVSPWLRNILLTTPIRRFDNLVQTCGLNVRTEYVLLGMIFAMVAIMAIADRFSIIHPLVGLAIGGTFGVVLPYLVISRLRARRMAKLTLQLPETLGMIVRSLRAGHPITACIGMVAKEMPEPIGIEFKRVTDAMLFNLALREALSRLAERLHMVPELHYLVAAIRIQAVSGGNLAEILESLATLMRDQQKLKLKIKAFSAEGRMSANILAALPIAMFVLINLINPAIYREAFRLNSVAQYGALSLATLLVVVGVIAARRIVKIRV